MSEQNPQLQDVFEIPRDPHPKEEQIREKYLSAIPTPFREDEMQHAARQWRERLSAMAIGLDCGAKPDNGARAILDPPPDYRQEFLRLMRNNATVHQYCSLYEAGAISREEMFIRIIMALDGQIAAYLKTLAGAFDSDNG